jgi:Holliday junction resolvase
MARQPEGRLQRRIRKALEKQVGGFWMKIHGSEFQRAGMGDLLGCVHGLFFSIEVKRAKKGKLSDVQIETLCDIGDEGGNVEVVVNSKQAVKFVQSVLADKKPRRKTLPSVGPELLKVLVKRR